MTIFRSIFDPVPSPTDASYRLPAEWEPQSGIQLTWPDAHTDWAPYLDEVTNTFLQLAHIITRYEKLLIVTSDPKATHAQLLSVLSPNQMQNTRLYAMDINDTWARDHGAITLKGNEGGNLLLDFKFNGWGQKFKYGLDNRITGNLFKQGAFNGRLEKHLDFVLEGGAIETDGRGTLLTTTDCMLSKKRNLNCSLATIANYLKRYLHVERVLWLKHGNLIGDDTDGHIDTKVRFAPNDTLLYIGCDDEHDEQYKDLQAMELELQMLLTADGNPYRLLRLPLPRKMTFDGERLPATYANFVILNGAVIVPTYGQKDLDEQALAAIHAAFPERDVYAVDASVVVRQHGSLHCLTMQYPEGVVK